MHVWLARQLDTVTLLVPAMVAGATVSMACVLTGWWVGRYHSWFIVRFVRLWVTRVVIPILRSPSWASRAAAIATNNVLTCTLLIAMGMTVATAWMAVVSLGLSLGIALRAMSAADRGDSLFSRSTPRLPPTKTVVGVALNMFEPPAIVVAIGLCLGQRAMFVGVTARQAWDSFAIWVVPMLLVAAAGEALWLDSGRRSP